MTLTASVPLGEVAEFIRGINFKPDDVVPVGSEGTVACMRTKNVQEKLDCDDVWGVPKNFVRRSDQILQEGDVLVSSANSWNLVGKCCWIPKLPWEASFGGFVSVLRAKADSADPRYVYRWFSSYRTQALLRSFGQKTTNISNLNIDRCLNLSIPLPPLTEQRRIAAILDQADALRAKRREALKQLDSLTQSIFIEMFGDPATNPKKWPLIPLGQISIFENGDRSSNYPSGDDIKESGVLFLSTKNITDRKLDLNSCSYITAEKFASLSRGKAKRNDIIITLRGTLGSCCIFDCEQETAFINAQMMIIRPSASCNTAYLHALLTLAQTKMMFDRIGHGAAVPQLTATQLARIEIPMPPLANQLAFAERLESLQAVKNTQTTAQYELDALFTSLQHRAFRGEL